MSAKIEAWLAEGCLQAWLNTSFPCCGSCLRGFILLRLKVSENLRTGHCSLTVEE